MLGNVIINNYGTYTAHNSGSLQDTAGGNQFNYGTFYLQLQEVINSTTMVPFTYNLVQMMAIILIFHGTIMDMRSLFRV
jgi:hypothetical protein